MQQGNHEHEFQFLNCLFCLLNYQTFIIVISLNYENKVLKNFSLNIQYLLKGFRLLRKYFIIKALQR